MEVIKEVYHLNDGLLTREEQPIFDNGDFQYNIQEIDEKKVVRILENLSKLMTRER